MVERTFSLDGTGSSGSPGGADGSADPFGAVPLTGGNDGAGSSGSGGGNGGNLDAFGTAFDPSIHSGRDKLNSDGSYRKKRGRKSGSTRPSASNSGQKTRSNYSASVDALANTLMIVHAGIASLTKIEELQIEKDESNALASSIANVLEQFDVTPDPKIQAIVGLVITAGTVYGPRMYLYNERVKQAKKKPASLHIIKPGGAPEEFNFSNQDQ